MEGDRKELLRGLLYIWELEILRLDAAEEHEQKRTKKKKVRVSYISRDCNVAVALDTWQSAL